MISVAASQYNPEARALEIYLSGCSLKCQGCHNPEIQSFGVGKKWPRWFRENRVKILNQQGLIDRVWLMGGNPTCQDALSFAEMADNLKATGKELWLWSGHSLSDISAEYSIAEYFRFVKTGKYIMGKDTVTYSVPGADFSVTLASSNQKLHVINASGEYVECPLKA